ncbi:hypothetical protein LCGC14_1433470 [marine sediment metagenome]|uniref:MotA/TolQ/ExbB proton channel domain-containing protein n=1 Tax=marine sediment metagenome TaxID=412755 RepID=A0A0F9M3D3_9ZZZZ
MKTLIGTLLILTGLALGVFVGGYVMLYGGIVQFIDGIQADPINSGNVALGAMRAAFFEIGGVVVAVIPVLFGMNLVRDAAHPRSQYKHGFGDFHSGRRHERF